MPQPALPEVPSPASSQVGRQADQQSAARALFPRRFHATAELRAIAKAHSRAVYTLLFQAASNTLLTLGRDPKWLGAELGLTAVLHTWARDLSFHPHVHCIVTAGGLTNDDRWIHSSHDFLFPIRVMSKLFRGKFLDGLGRLRREQQIAGHLETDAFDALVQKLYATDWNVYSKAPFAGPKQIFRYLGQYTHRVGISNYRLVALDERGVTFKTRGEQTVSLSPEEFVGRFLQHVLPKHFVKIRHYGLMANGSAVVKREQAREVLQGHPPDADAETQLPDGWESQLQALTGVDVSVCPKCGQKAVVRLPLPRTMSVAKIRQRTPPEREVAA